MRYSTYEILLKGFINQYTLKIKNKKEVYSWR